MQNLSNGDPRQAAEVVFGFDKPDTLSTWRGAQYSDKRMTLSASSIR